MKQKMDKKRKEHQKIFKHPGQSKFFESIEIPIEIVIL